MSGNPEMLLVVNRAAGTAQDDRVEAAVAGLRKGGDVSVAATADAADLDEALAAHPGSRVVVLGGDGSVHAVVAALDRAGRLSADEPVGIIACGTGNDLARTLGLPLDPADGAAAVLAGVPRRLDLLRDDAGAVVVNAVHAGVGAEAAAEAHRLKQRLGAVAYPVGAAIAGLGDTGWPLRVEVDGCVAVHEAEGWAADGAQPVLMVGVCNGATIGGGTALAPDARPDDGLADVVVCAATGPVARAAYAAALTAGRHVDRTDVLLLRGREVRISGGPVPVDADGELGELRQAGGWRLAHHAWSVLVPR
ncbi:diacylglycerol/lipid kinase family protein [Blastococcus sp. SYSU DS0510]